MLPLVTFRVAVEIPTSDELSGCSAKNTTSMVQEVWAASVCGQCETKKKLSALAPVPGVMEILSGAGVLPPLVTVTLLLAKCSASTSPKLMLVGLTVTPLTVRLADAVFPVPPLVDVTLPVVFVKLPG